VVSGQSSAVAGRITATTDFAILAQCDAAIICVPTPLNKTRDPDVRYVIAAGESVAQHMHPGMLVVLESTTYPGTTEELLLPMLNQGIADFESRISDLPHRNPQSAIRNSQSVGHDFFLAFSPERIDPGNQRWVVENTPKVVGGVTPACREVAVALYGTIIERIVPVSSTQAAEMVKLLENTFRAVNIALVNEIAVMCDKLALDPWEVIEAAATKPYGFMKFTPGPGVGGHCIPLDPFYLSWKMKTLNYNARFIQLAGEINSEMPRYWVDKVVDALNEVGKPLKGSRVLVLGVAYKKDIDDVRESPALDVIELLRQKGADVRYHDPYVPSIRHNGFEMAGETDLDAALAAADCAVVVTDHSCYDWAAIRRQVRLIVDTRHAAV
jgi:UDP-N-acetyl-D-glucosamine dehydrogenase